MAIIGQGVQAGLGRVDYTPYLQGAMAGAQGIAQGISSIGQSAAQGVRDYAKNKEEERSATATIRMSDSLIKGMRALADQKDANGKPLIAPEIKASLDEFALTISDPGLSSRDRARVAQQGIQQYSSLINAGAQASAAARQAQIESLQIKALQDAEAKRAQEAANIRAATAAYGAVPQRVPEIVRDTISTYVTPAPKLEDFLYSSGAATTSPVAIKVNPMPKDIQDFALRNPEDGSIIGIDRRTMSRFAAEQAQARAPILDEIAKLSSQAGPLSGVSRGPGAAFMGMGAGVSRPSAKVESQIKQAQSKLEAIDKETQTVFSKIRDWESNRPSFKTSVESLPPNSLVQKAAKQVERTVERDASTDEKTASFITSYIKGGGTVTPDFIDKARDAFKTEMAVYDAGDGVMAVRVGNSAQIIDRGKPMNAAQLKEMKGEQYQKLLSGLAESSEWDTLPIDLKKTISELAAAHEKNQNLMGTRMSGQEAFIQRRQELLGAGKASAPATAGATRPAQRPTMSMPSGWSLR